MKIGTFEHAVTISADVATVMNVVCDYSQQPQFHPLIVRVEQATTAPAGILKRYIITDRLRWGPFAFKIRYRAEILAITGDTVHARAYQFPNIRISVLTQVASTNEGVLLRETFTMQAPTLLFNYAFGQAKMAHALSLQRIRDFVEGISMP
jgi:hypothetical protein